MSEADRTNEQADQTTPTGLLEVVRHLDWRDESLAIAIIIAESFLVWLVASLLLMTNGEREGYPFWIIAMLMLVPYFILHILEAWRVFSPDFEIIIGVSIVFFTLVAIKFASFPDIPVWDPLWLQDTARSITFLDNSESRAVWGSMIVAGYGWWRARFREEPSIDSAYTMLRWGSLALAIILVVIFAGAPDEAEVRTYLSIGTIGFFVASLSSIGLARLKLEGFRTAEPLGPRWLATFVMPILAVVLVGILAAGIFSRRFYETVLWLLTPVFFILQIVFQIIIIIIAVLAFLILTPIFWLLGDRSVVIPSVAPTATIIGESGEQTISEPDPFQLPEPLRYLIAAIFLFVIISALAKFFFRRRGRQRESTQELRESVLDWGDLLDSAANRLKNLLKRKPKFDPFASLRGLPEWRFTIQIREYYINLQHRGEEAGRPRETDETAEEYRPQIGKRFTEEKIIPEEVDQLTTIYRKTRYSGRPASEQEAVEAGAAWRSIERAHIKPVDET